MQQRNHLPPPRRRVFSRSFDTWSHSKNSRQEASEQSYTPSSLETTNNNNNSSSSSMDRPPSDESYVPRGSIRNLRHDWDTTYNNNNANRSNNFPIQEIQRIKTKTSQLRRKKNKPIIEFDAQSLRSSKASSSNPSSLVKHNKSKSNHKSALQAAQQQLLAAFHSSRTTNNHNNSDDDDNVTAHNTSSESGHSSNNNNNLTLHDLVGEATTPDDIAWRNALQELTLDPTLAQVRDSSQQWLPLHICCLSPAPMFMLRALLLAHPTAVSQVDGGGRLPLHLLAASGGDFDSLQALVRAHPDSLWHLDERGCSPLHLLLRNPHTSVTPEKVHLLLGHYRQDEDDPARMCDHRKRVVRQRRSEHLGLSVSSVNAWQSQSKTPVVTNFLNHNLASQNDPHFDNYPADVQVALRKLAQWVSSRNNNTPSVELLPDNDQEWERRNPAAIPLGDQYPIHRLVDRVFGGASNGEAVAQDQTDDAELSSNPSDSSDEPQQQEERSESATDNVVHAVSILRLLAASHPDALVLPGNNGLTPLLNVLLHTTTLPNMDVVEILLGKRAPGYNSPPSWADDLPYDTINPAMVSVAQTGQLPLHIAAEELSTDYGIMRSIVESYPGAIQVADGRGRTPLHLALSSYRGVRADERVLDLLFSDRVAQIVDDHGQLPFDLLVQSKLDDHRPHDTSSYRRLIQSSVMGAGRPDNVHKRDTFLSRLRSMPPWLRSEACSTTIVQDLLVEDLANPWKFALILLDGLLLMGLITVFRVQMKQYVDALDRTDDLLSSWYTYGVYATAIARLFGQVVVGAIAFSISEFRHLCLFNLWYWLDLGAMLLTIVTSVLLYSSTNEEKLLGLGTVSTCLLWLSLIGYLSNWWYGMALFAGGFTKTASRLVPPLVAAGSLIIACAQCFFTLLQLDCTEALGGTPVCTERDSYRVVYMLLRGESLIDSTGEVPWTREATMLVTSVLVLFGIFIVAVVVTVLLATAPLDFDQIARTSYWEPKLAFSLSVEDFGITRPDQPCTNPDTLAKQLEATWDQLVHALLGMDTVKKGDNNWYVSQGTSKLLNWIKAVVILPCWVLAGAFSLGVFWPPQIRRRLFRPSWTRDSEEQSAREQAEPQLSSIREEVTQLKLLSFEKTRDVERELRELKELLYMAMQDED